MSESEEIGGAIDGPKKSSKILPLMLVVNTLLLTGVLVFVMKRPSAQAAAPAGGAGHEEAKGEEKEAKGGEGHEAKGEGGHGKAEGHEAKGGEGHEGGGENGEAAASVRLDAFIVQVRTADGDRYAHLTLEVEVGSEADKKAFESRTPRIRDAVIAYLSDRTEDELRGSEGLAQVKTALAKKLDDIVPGHRVRGLFVTEFIIQ